MSKDRRLAMDMAKELMIAQLSNGNSPSPSANAGKAVGDMYEAIFNKLLTIISADSPEE